MKKKKDDESFGSSFKKLEIILEKLENEIEDHSLEEIIKNYEEAQALLKFCRKKLEEAELKIEKIGAEEEN
ncbi:MAG: exodeoxyribonuclease VII small subunit [Bacteroidetes bacterium]|nr:exodeoxyribonuclease VII small subunit [Bacteroidota bacterium]